jgi:hypothetical protein
VTEFWSGMENEAHELRQQLIDLQNRCGLCICGEGATDECCKSCIAGGPDVFTQLGAAKKAVAALERLYGPALVEAVCEFKRLVGPDPQPDHPTCGTCVEGPTYRV